MVTEMTSKCEDHGLESRNKVLMLVLALDQSCASDWRSAVQSRCTDHGFLARLAHFGCLLPSAALVGLDPARNTTLAAHSSRTRTSFTRSTRK